MSSRCMSLLPRTTLHSDSEQTGLIFLALLSSRVFSALKGLSSEIFSAESGNILFIYFKGRGTEYWILQVVSLPSVG
jgi:hypothetical protein